MIRSRLGALAVAALFASAGAVAAGAAVTACSSDDRAAGVDLEDSGSADDGASTNGDSGSGTEDAGADASTCPKTTDAVGAGETCTGFGRGAPCDTSCGLPPYGYACIDGGPPGLTGCVLASSSPFGQTYCCPKNECVAEPDQDAKCAGVSGKPHLYECPPINDEPGVDGGVAAAPPGCAPRAVPASPFHYECCP
jgi:hypothetical protein